MIHYFWNNNPPEEVWLEGFFKCHKFQRIAIHTDGTVLNLDTLKLVRPGLDRQYPRVRISEVNRDVAIHRLLAETFIPIPENLLDHPRNKLEVNHINGIKNDFTLSNLEWVDRRQNTIHAFSSGLRPEVTPVLAKNITTGEIRRYYTLQECARQFGVNGSRIYYILKKCPRQRVHFEEWLFIYEGEEWPAPIKNLRVLGVPQSIRIEDKETGEVTVATSMKEASDIFGISRVHMGNVLLRNKESDNHPVEYRGKVLSYILDKYPSRRLDSVGNRTNSRKPYPIRVTDTQTGEMEMVSSVIEYVKREGVLRNTFQKNILVNGSLWKGRYKIEYMINGEFYECGKVPI